MAGLGQHRRRGDGAEWCKKAGSAKSRNIRRVLNGLPRRRRRKNDLVRVGLAVLVLLGIWLEMLARIVVLHMIGEGHDGYDDN